MAAIAGRAQSSLEVNAPAAGVVLTQDPSALLHQDVATGQALLTLAESGQRVARLYVPAAALDRIPTHAEVALMPPGRFGVIRAALPQLDGEAVTLPAGLIASQDYKGVVLPTFYSARIPLPASDGAMPLGAAGQARIFGQRRSLFERAAGVVLNLVRAHVW